MNIEQIKKEFFLNKDDNDLNIILDFLVIQKNILSYSISEWYSISNDKYFGCKDVTINLGIKSYVSKIIGHFDSESNSYIFAHWLNTNYYPDWKLIRKSALTLSKNPVHELIDSIKNNNFPKHTINDKTYIYSSKLEYQLGDYVICKLRDNYYYSLKIVDVSNSTYYTEYEGKRVPIIVYGYVMLIEKNGVIVYQNL